VILVLPSRVGSACACVRACGVGVLVMSKCFSKKEGLLYSILPRSKKKGQLLVVCDSSRSGEGFSITSRGCVYDIVGHRSSHNRCSRIW